MPEYYIQPVTNRQECYTCHKVVTGKKKFSKCSKCHAITYCSRECQKKDWRRHGWNCVPVMVTEIPGRGRGLIAAKDIKKGELIFIDKPLIQVDKTKFLADTAAESFLILKKIENLPSEAKLQFYRLKGSDNKCYEDLKSSQGELMGPVDVFLRNAAVKNLSFYLYLNIALLNHSCAPNADAGKLLEKNNAGKLYNRIEIRAIKDISKGEEITFCVSLGTSITCAVLRTREARKIFIKEEFGFECKCCACSDLDADQENIAMELFEHIQTLTYTDIYKKDWARDAEKLDKINDLTQKFRIGNAEFKWNSMISLAKTAQLARNQNLVTKGLNMLKKFSGDIQMEEARQVYEKLERDLAQWSNNLKSKKTPTRKEIEFICKDLLERRESLRLRGLSS